MEQQHESGWRPVAFASRRTSCSERNYPTHKLEFLALRWAICEKFKDYLTGCEFEVFTDNNPLTHVWANAKLDATAQRWVSSLETFNFKVIYRPGKINTVADSLSRLYCDESENTTMYKSWANNKCHGFPEDLIGDTNTSIVASIINNFVHIPTINDFDWVKLQGVDQDIQTIIKCIQQHTKPTPIQLKELPPDAISLLRNFNNLKVYRNLLCYSDNDDIKLVIPVNQRQDVVRLYHSFGLFGVTRTSKLIQERFFWPRIKDTVSAVCETCERCQKAKTPKHANKGPLEHLITPQQPMHTLSMNTAETLYRAIYTKFGIPEVIHSDRGQTFLSNVLKQVNELLSIKHTVTTPYRPQSNGTCERLNSTILSRIRTLLPNEKSRWHLHLDSLMLAYNSTVHESTQTSPFYIMFGRKPRIPMDLMMRLPRFTEKGPIDVKNFATKREQELKASFELCAKNIDKRKERSMRNFDSKLGKPTLNFKPADRILLRKHSTKNKIDDRFQAEIYEVVHKRDTTPVYIVKGLESGMVKSIHRDNIILFKEACEPASSLTLDDITPWQQLHTKSFDFSGEELEFSIKRQLNSKVSILYGDSSKVKTDTTIIVPKDVSEDHINQQLKSAKDNNHHTAFVVIDNLCSKRSSIRIVLSAIRTCIVHKDWVKIVIWTKEHTIYNILLQEMHRYFPKSPIIRKPVYVSESDDKSDYSSEDGSKRHSLQAVELSQWFQAAVQIVSNLPAPSNGGPIYRFLGMPVMRTHWMAGAAAHKSG